MNVSHHSSLESDIDQTNVEKRIKNSMKTLCFRLMYSLALCLSGGLFVTPHAIGETIRISVRPKAMRTTAPGFTLSNSSGQLLNASKYRGEVLVLNFWATECGGCRLEIPTFVEISSQYQPKRVVVVGVAMDVWFEQLKSSKDAWDRVTPFVAAHQINYTMLMGDDAIKQAFKLTELPVTVLIDARGRIAATYVGIVDKDNLKANLNELSAEH